MTSKIYVIFNVPIINLGLSDIATELSRIDFVVTNMLEDEFSLVPFLSIESMLDEDFLAELWHESGKGAALIIAEMIDSPQFEYIKNMKYDGLISITYLNEDRDIGNIRQEIESRIKRLVGGIIYESEQGVIR